MSRKIVVVGSSNIDIAIRVKNIPKAGETVIGGRLSITAGGKGANQALAAIRAGGDVSFISRLGSDMFGDTLMKGFVGDGLDVRGVARDPEEPSGTALIFVDEKGENSIAVAPGANAKLSPANIIDDKRNMISGADILLMQLEIPMETIEAATRIAVENDVAVILNPAPAQYLTDDLLKKISIITPNKGEAEVLTGVSIKNENDAENAARTLMARGAGAVVITLGPNGAFVLSSEHRELLPSYRVKAVDSTAAGDVFNGALAVALSEGEGLTDAVKFANAAAALSVTKPGAQSSIPYREEIQEVLKGNTMTQFHGGWQHENI